ncbi:hypothetical protein HAX54_047688 [Datura stramonium]|uniref:Uncharacterized protein n=1 Tax=Datura stramonium TaxID=4076 RepID=A0ABS8WLC0_DATST|nr:hypothetical protein [Datura stramonium]
MGRKKVVKKTKELSIAIAKSSAMSGDSQQQQITPRKRGRPSWNGLIAKIEGLTIGRGSKEPLEHRKDLIARDRGEGSYKEALHSTKWVPFASIDTVDRDPPRRSLVGSFPSHEIPSRNNKCSGLVEAQSSNLTKQSIRQKDAEPFVNNIFANTQDTQTQSATTLSKEELAGCMREKSLAIVMTQNQVEESVYRIMENPRLQITRYEGPMEGNIWQDSDRGAMKAGESSHRSL